MKHLTPERIQKRGEGMLAKAKERLARLKGDPAYIERIHILALADMLEMFGRKKFTDEESVIMQQVLLSSNEAMHVLNRVIDTILWTRTSEGKSFLQSLEEAEKAA